MSGGREVPRRDGRGLPDGPATAKLAGMSTSDQATTSEPSAAQRAAFRRDGFVVLRGFFDAAQTAGIAAWCDEIAAWPETVDGHMVYYEDSLNRPGTRVIQRIEDLTPFHAGFRELMTHGRLAAAAGALLGGPAVLFKDKINFKLPGGDGFKAHQDQQAGWSAYAPYFVTALVAIDEATAENGCLELAAGWHERGLLGKEWAPLDGGETAEMDFVPCRTAPGDAVFFDSFAPHRSGPNLSGRPRRALYVTYNASAAGDHRRRYFAEKRRSFPPDVARKPGETYVFRV